MICMVCKCTDDNACVDEATGDTCAWADYDGAIVNVDGLGVCTFCAAAADAGDPEVLARIHEVVTREKATEPLVQLYSDYEATQYLRARAAGA